MPWTLILCVFLGAGALAIVRPWRFWYSRNRCHQCRNLLPRWNCWGWQQDWTCGNCGCQVSR